MAFYLCWTVQSRERQCFKWIHQTNKLHNTKQAWKTQLREEDGRGRLRRWEGGTGSKGETLTCFSPSILLSACWTASRYLKCNSISRSTWREDEIEAGREKARDAVYQTATRKWEKHECERREQKEKTEQDEIGGQILLIIFIQLIVQWFFLTVCCQPFRLAQAEFKKQKKDNQIYE